MEWPLFDLVVLPIYNSQLQLAGKEIWEKRGLVWRAFGSKAERRGIDSLWRGQMACCERLREYAGGLHREKMAQLRAEAEAGRDGFSPAPNDYAASAKHNASGGSMHVAGQRDGSQQRGAKLEQGGKSVPFRSEKTERAESS